MISELQSMTSHINTTVNATAISQPSDNSKSNNQQNKNKVPAKIDPIKESIGYEIVTSKLDDDEPSPAPYSGMHQETQ